MEEATKYEYTTDLVIDLPALTIVANDFKINPDGSNITISI